jgi:hypothetical protein
MPLTSLAASLLRNRGGHMKNTIQKSRHEFKRKLIFRYGSLLAASRALHISYHRLMNILNGRTQLADSEQDAFSAIEEKFFEQDADQEAR